MKILFLDTSCRLARVFLIEDGALLSEASDDGVKTHASMLFPCIGKVLEDAGAALEDIDVFSVTAGPGSYTGLRISMAAAKTLSYSLKKPLVPVNTLRYLAASVSVTPDIRVSLIDGRNTLCYYLLSGDGANRGAGTVFDKVGSDYLDKICCVVKDALRPGLPAVFTGDGALNYRSLIAELLPEARFAPEGEICGTYSGAYKETMRVLGSGEDAAALDAQNAAVNYYKDVHVTVKKC